MARLVGLLGEFGDLRRAAAGNRLLERIVETRSLVVKELGEDRAGEAVFHRFLDAPSVSFEEMVLTLSARTGLACAGRRVVAVQDTTEVGFSRRQAGRQGLGAGCDGKSPAFFIHPVLAIDADEDCMLGIVDAQIWTRSEETVTARAKRALAEKESVRWLKGAEATGQRLAQAASVTLVSDRESDVYESLAGYPAGVALIVRARHERALAEGSSLFAAAASWPELVVTDVKVAPRGPGDPGRVARVVLRAGPVEVKRPASVKAAGAPARLSLGFVEAREVNAPEGVHPLLWRLLTTLPVASAEEAQEVVRQYRLRWRIEETFRALKSDGMRIEETQLRQAHRMFKLAVAGLEGAVRTIQLVDARDGGSRPASDVIDPALLPAVAAIGRTLEGKTSRQQNPHPPNSLAFVSWIVARLGGWNCYYKPPGPKTMNRGWPKLMNMIAGISLANNYKQTKIRNV